MGKRGSFWRPSEVPLIGFLALAAALVPGCGNPAAVTQSSSAILMSCPADETGKITFCHREGRNEVGNTIKTSVEGCLHGHGGHADDYLGVCCDPACEAGWTCLAGVCTPPCGPDQTVCSGACVDVSTDPTNCGACAKACDQGQRCSGGKCLTLCEPFGYVDLMTNLYNCGGCGQACQTSWTPPAACSGGSCVAGGSCPEQYSEEACIMIPAGPNPSDTQTYRTCCQTDGTKCTQWCTATLAGPMCNTLEVSAWVTVTPGWSCPPP